MEEVVVQGIPVAFERRGSGTPIVLIHGWQGDHRYMSADLEPVFGPESGWRRMYVDLPGHGQTSAPLWLEGQPQVISILIDALEAIVAGEPFAVAGNSYGGYLTLGLVRAIPERLLGAALLVPDLPAADGSRDTPPHVTLVEAPTATFDDLADDERWIPDRLVQQSRRAVSEIREHDMPAIRIADQPFLERLEADYQLPAELQTARAAFPRPSLIVTGRQDATVGYEAAWRLRDEFPRATIATLDLAGHWLGRVERPHAFRALVRDWLERIQMDAT
jgi:pimeloyl-ACP methyl ester carboxylesterase